MIQELSKRRSTVQMRIPQSDYAVVSEVMRQGNVLMKEYDENDVILQVDLPVSLVERLKSYIPKVKK